MRRPETSPVGLASVLLLTAPLVVRMVRILQPIATVIALSLVPLAACKRDSEVDEARKVIQEVKEEAADTRTAIQEKQEGLQEDEREIATDRAEFIEETRRSLGDLDRDIEELRADLERRASEFKADGKRDIERSLAELDKARTQAVAAFDRFKRSSEATEIRREAESAVDRTRAAVREARDRLRGEPATDEKLDREVRAADRDDDGRPDAVEIK